jgi:class 3 adenylate cyclase/CHASE2 domain-containing sensor protein
MKRRSVCTALVISLAVILSLLLMSECFVLLDNRAYDLRMQLLEQMGWGKRSTGKVVLVAMEESSTLARKPLIFWYPELGSFFSALRGSGVKAVGIDMIPVHSMAVKLREVVSSPAILPANVQLSLLDTIGEAVDDSLLRPLKELAETVPIVMATYHTNVPYFHEQLPFLRNITAASAAITADAVDGVLRKQSGSLEQGKPFFAAALYAAATGQPVQTGQITVDFSRQKSMPVISFDSYMNGTTDREILRDKIVILGFLSPVDRHPTSLSKLQYGPLIHALTLESMLAKEHIQDAPLKLQWLLLALLALSGTLTGLCCRPLTAFATAILIAAIYLAMTVAAMVYGSVLTVFPHLLSPFIALMITYPYRYLFEEKTKRKIYRVFNYYLDQQVIDELVAGDVDNLLRGERKQITIMFIDIRNFTAMSQKITPEAVISLLNSFFGRVTEIIQAHNGIVNKFIGDGVMAFFPLPQTAGVDAINAAREIVAAAGEVNLSGMLQESCLNEAAARFAVGIGLHYGDVIMGNVGSERKMDFTVMGPTVNLASRIEGLTKEFGCALLFSEAVQERVQHVIQCRYLGEARVKGVVEEVRVYTA